MLLRRITQHVKDQNWFAVGIDFVIVVVGILIAFQITNWNEAREAQSNLERAEVAIDSEVFALYRNFKERAALTNCRKESLHDLGQRLLKPGDMWQPSFREDVIDLLVFRAVLRSPNRPWRTFVWDSELTRGTLNIMESGKRQDLELVYDNAKYAEKIQDSILAAESKLKTLAYTRQIAQPDRLRYFDILSEIDQNSLYLEWAAQQTIEVIESHTFNFSQADQEQYRKGLQDLNERTVEIYGICATEIEMPILEEQE